MDKVRKEDLAEYIKKLELDEDGLIVFDERYVSNEMGKQVMDLLKGRGYNLPGIILPDLEGIGILTLPKKPIK